MADVQMEGLIDYMMALLGKQFDDKIGQIYFGDVITYPPQAFKSNRGEPRAAVSLLPNYDEEEVDGSTAAAEMRKLGLYIVVMVDMTPTREAVPVEGFGERQLVRLVSQIREFLSHQSLFTLNGRITTRKIGGVKWNWVQRDNQSMRAAALEYEATVYIPKQD